jgi:peptide/nickel transport system ATP-binding protein
MDPRLDVLYPPSCAGRRMANCSAHHVDRVLPAVPVRRSRRRKTSRRAAVGLVPLARALAGQPRVLIADEITSALDVSIQGTVLNLMREQQQQLHLTMLFISHNLAVVRYVSEVIAVMYLGRIVEYGPTADVLTNPQHPYTRDLLASAPDPNTRTLTTLASDPVLQAVSDTEPADPHHPPTGCRYHPRCPIGPPCTPTATPAPPPNRSPRDTSTTRPVTTPPQPSSRSPKRPTTSRGASSL